ncbi:ribonuclease III [Clostridium oryzae]|uniref:Ribonuclease 3 n=1 Tax=Clostridium oryzae TaxID=1450648 RepID=A0A1V4IP10_9CLOT|nr:ribonuclease III [Clostridium oryzae]OPJ61778.1 ribonuclease 3 [Clostridium oryzae]
MNYDKDVLKELEKTIGVIFENNELLNVAITHSSFAHQKNGVQFNERLEFLGDSVLQLTITEYLYKKYKRKTEGDLTKLRALIVCENSLYEVGRGWNLGQYIYMSKGEELTGGRSRVSIQADCVEAIIAAVYLDKGFEYARDFILRIFKNIIDKALKNKIVMDYKTKLQEVLQKDGEVKIEYNIVKYEGPPHRRKFFANLNVNDVQTGEGVGYSKKEAEQEAAKMALEEMEEKL